MELLRSTQLGKKAIYDVIFTQVKVNNSSYQDAYVERKLNTKK